VARHTRGFGGAPRTTLGTTRVAPPPQGDDVPMFTSASQIPARELHRSQRALVAASLLACPRDARPARRSSWT